MHDLSCCPISRRLGSHETLRMWAKSRLEEHLPREEASLLAAVLTPMLEARQLWSRLSIARQSQLRDAQRRRLCGFKSRSKGEPKR